MCHGALDGQRGGHPVDHPSEDTLKRFATGKASREEGRVVVAHLIKGCASCAARLKALMEPSQVASQYYELALGRPIPDGPASPRPPRPFAPTRGLPCNSERAASGRHPTRRPGGFPWGY